MEKKWIFFNPNFLSFQLKCDYHIHKARYSRKKWHAQKNWKNIIISFFIFFLLFVIFIYICMLLFFVISFYARETHREQVRFWNRDFREKFTFFFTLECNALDATEKKLRCLAIFEKKKEKKLLTRVEKNRMNFCWRNNFIYGHHEL